MEEIPRSEQPPLFRIGISYNLKKNVASDVPDNEAEYDDYETILAIKSALEGPNRSITLLEADEGLPCKLAEKNLDMVFNIAEGTAGRAREAQVPAMLNFFGIPFTGSDGTTLCLALDKALTKRILSSYRVRTPKYTVIGNKTKAAGRGLAYPAIVKPNAEGSGKGISSMSIVSDAREMRRAVSKCLALYQQDMLVEEYIAGREFTVGILGNGNDTKVFPPMEVIYRNRENRFNIYSYDVKKHFRDHITYECPAKLPAGIISEMENTARKIYDVLGCLDFARIDFRLSEEGLLYFIEINPLPGLAPGYSDYPMLADFCGMDYTALIRGIMDAAIKRYGLNFYF